MNNYNSVLSWWIVTTQKNNNVYDNVFIVYNNSNVIYFYPFKRIKTASCDISESACSTNYSQNINFINLMNKLNKYTKPAYIEKKIA